MSRYSDLDLELEEATGRLVEVVARIRGPRPLPTLFLGRSIEPPIDLAGADPAAAQRRALIAGGHLPPVYLASRP